MGDLTPPPTDPALLAAANRALVADLEAARAERDAAIAERDRLADWLLRIDGGDHPCDDAATLRRWAYEAVTLRREVPHG